MNIKKNLLSRMTRRKDSKPVEPEEEAYEIPPPTAIEPGVPYSTEDTEDKGYGSHLELELLATGEPPQPDPVNGADAPEPSRELEVHQEYGLEMEVLAASESDELPAAPEPPQEDEEAVSAVAESAMEVSAPEPEILQEIEQEAIGDPAPEFEGAPDAVQSVVEGYVPVAPEVFEESEVRVIEAAVSEDEEPLAASIPDDSVDEAEMSHGSEPLEGYGEGFEVLAAPETGELPDAAEPPQHEPSLEDEVAVLETVESVMEASAPELEVPQETEPEVVDEMVQEVGEPLASSFSAESPVVESPEPSIAENGVFPLVRDSRGAWRPGKGFSRSELQEAGLSLADAARLRIRVDKRRRNAHPVNVEVLEQAKSGS